MQPIYHCAPGAKWCTAIVHCQSIGLQLQAQCCCQQKPLLHAQPSPVLLLSWVFPRRNPPESTEVVRNTLALGALILCCWCF